MLLSIKGRFHSCMHYHYEYGIVIVRVHVCVGVCWLWGLLWASLCTVLCQVRHLYGEHLGNPLGSWKYVRTYIEVQLCGSSQCSCQQCSLEAVLEGHRTHPPSLKNPPWGYKPGTVPSLKGTTKVMRSGRHHIIASDWKSVLFYTHWTDPVHTSLTGFWREHCSCRRVSCNQAPSFEVLLYLCCSRTMQ